MTSVNLWVSIITIIIGLVVFLYLILNELIKKKFKLSELDNGEIRKAIMVVFTVIYIIVLPYYFFNAYMPAAVNLSTTNASELVTPKTSNQIMSYNTSINSVPATSVNNLLGNFLWVYMVLIAFYFGSRTLDGYTEAKRIESLKGSNPVEIIKTQYARGKIDEATMRDQLKRLEVAETSSEGDRNQLNK